mmetsp:Transcript_13917/g.48085  ORF Transcript_13917/g.48085 Transcript_13917/m.48085 type:complete len:88 (+) Transcript_13917:659-922(+)
MLCGISGGDGKKNFEGSKACSTLPLQIRYEDHYLCLECLDSRKGCMLSSFELFYGRKLGFLMTIVKNPIRLAAVSRATRRKPSLKRR